MNKYPVDIPTKYKSVSIDYAIENEGTMDINNTVINSNNRSIRNTGKLHYSEVTNYDSKKQKNCSDTSILP